MLRRLAAFGAVLAFVGISASPTHAIQRVAQSWGFLEVSGGFAKPLGSYNGTAFGDFTYNGRLLDIDGDDLYDGGVFFKVALGALHQGRFQGSVGFGFARNNVNNPVVAQVGDNIVQYSWTYGGTSALIQDMKLSQYDLDVNLNFLPLDLHRMGWSPYVGLGFHAGYSTLSGRDVQSESEGNIGLGLNFGAEIRLFEDKGKRSFVTLASVNSWDFAVSGDRPKYLQVGGGLRWYFKY